MRSNPATTRLCWFMVAVMASDFALTLAGQPAIYWTDHSKALELNSLVAWAMRHGPATVIAGWIIYAVAGVALVKLLPGRLGLIAALTFIFAHFSAASGWLVYRFHLGLAGLYLFSFAVAAVLVMACLERQKARLPAQPTC